MPTRKKNALEKKEKTSESDGEEETKNNKKISSSKEDKEKLEKIRELKEKAAEFASKIETKEINIKKEIAEDDKGAVTLVPTEDYFKSSIHLGTRAITPDMKQYVYKRRADGLAVFNTSLIDKKIREGAEILSKYSQEDIIVVCKREAGFKAAEMFSKVTGIRIFAKTEKYSPGILTNPNLDAFIEPELVVICDPWVDKAALDEARKVRIPVLAICDANNYTKDIDFIIPGNNKSAKSLGLIFYLLAKIYVEKRKIKTEVPPISEWIEGWDSLVPPK